IAAAAAAPTTAPATAPATQPAALVVRTVMPLGFEVHRGTTDGPPLLVANAAPGFRPHVHPLYAPDGSGVLTQKPTKNYVHHCGLWFGLNNVIVNGKKLGFFYPNDAFDPKPMDPPKLEGGRVSWTVVDDWRPFDAKKNVAGPRVLTETQRWALTDRGSHYWLDLDQTLTAAGADVTFGKADYGGLFVRLEDGSQIGARNSEGVVNTKTDREAVEGKQARWLLLRDGGKTRGGKPAYVVLMDHKANAGHPVAWRQTGNHMGTSRCKTEEWTLKANESATSRYRILVATGEPDVAFVETVWQDFVGGGAGTTNAAAGQNRP
ncbi:MAG TPA: DUF6807 family protein, partial [Humisphaera sp.]